MASWWRRQTWSNSESQPGTWELCIGGGTLLDGGALNIGEDGSGTLNITKGGTVSDSDATVGSGSGATGTALVDGPGSTWSHDGAITIGENANATGTLTISNGGTMSTGGTGAGSVIGHNPKSSGTVNVSGAGSTWINSAALALSDAGGVGILNILDGGVVSVAVPSSARLRKRYSRH